MSDKHIVTTISELSAIFVAMGGDTKTIRNLAEHNQPKLKSGRRKMSKIDPNLNKTFKIQRINYSVIATISLGRDDLYEATITSFDKGDSPHDIGASFPISKGELKLTGVVTSSK